MKHILLACILILSLGLNSFGQASADPGLSPIFFTTLSNNALAANALPFGTGFKINVPFFNATAGVALPAGSCKLKIGLGSKLGINPGFDVTTAAYSQYFSWTLAFAGGQWQITGDLIADLPGGFSGTAVFEVTGTVNGNSTATGNFLVTNHNTSTTLSDIDGTNNGASTAYTVVSLVSISINQGSSITVCQNASLTLTTTTVGTGPFTYLWNNGLGTSSSATPPTSAIGTVSYSVTVTDVASITATANISVTVNGPGTITASAGANGTISSPGATIVPCGTNKTYTITPASCYRVLDVLVDGVSQGAITSYTFNNVTSNHTIAATFAINTFIITVNAGANGTITPGTGTVNCGSNNAYAIAANPCYHIVDVTLDGVSQGAVTTLNVNNVTSNHTVAATFAINTFAITVNAGANGTITPGTGTVNCGSNNAYVIAANPCYHIVDVMLDGISQGAVATLNVNNVTSNHTLAATFAINTFAITVNAGANGTITPGTGTVNCGSNNAYVIAANPCYHIVDVTLDGVSQGAVTTLNVNNVTSNHTIAATFAINTFTITVNAGVNGTITPGTGTVNCGSNNSYAIAANPCYHIVDVTLDGVSQGAVTTLNVNNVTSNHTIAATFAINTFAITVNAGANGTITPGTGTVNCGSNNAYVIAANPCYHIVDVMLDGISQGALTSLNVNNVTANHTVAATFAINTFIITVNAGANGTITPGTGTVNCGSNNTYTIAANPCYHIVDVTLDGISQGAVTTLSVNNVTSNHTIAAIFAINTFTITVNVGANGTITPGTGTVNCGSNNSYAIAANPCYHIVDVTLDGISQGAVTTLNVNNVTSNHTIAATFAINTFAITVNAGANGTITPGTGTVNCGSNNTYTIAANPCYHIVDVTLDGISQGAVTTLSVNNVTSNHTIAATFAINTFIITVNAGANGTITPGTGTVNCGSNNTYTIAANPCYHIVDVTLDGISQGAVTTLSVNNVTSNHTIAATFAINTFTITVNAGANGTITPGTGTVNCGSNNSYAIAANPCYHIVDVTLDGISQGAVTTLNVNNVTSNHTIAATFAINTFTITVNAGANGTITPGTGTVNCGSNNAYAIAANPCYHIVDVTLDGVSQGAITTLNVNNVTSNHTIAATFAINTFTITVSAGANGTITPGTGTVNCGSNNAYAIAANPCYHIVDVILDGVSQGAVTTLNVNNVTSNHTIAASFTQDIIPVPMVTVVDHCDGTSTLTASGYTGTLLWSDGATENPHIVTVANDYTVTQFIATCSSNPSVPVTTTPGTVTSPVFIIIQPDCSTSTGSLSISSPTATGMTYSIDGISYINTTGMFPSVATGSYNVTAKAIDGCISNISIAEIDPQPSAPAISVLSIINNTCHGGEMGKITVAGSGGTEPYTYSIISGPTINTTGLSSGVFTGLAAGNYLLGVSTTTGCNNSVAATVTQPPGIFPDITAGADYTGNFFAVSGEENTLIYNISEIGGNPAIGDTLRITRVPGYNLIFDPTATSVINGSVNYTLDNGRWKMDNSNGAFISLIFDPVNNSTSGTLNCSERVYISVRLQRNTFNISTFTLTARLRKTNNEQSLSNNLAPVLFTAE